MPGVVLLDMAIAAIAQAHASSLASTVATHITPNNTKILSSKFLSPVSPGETLTLSWEVAATGSIRFDITRPQTKVATGVLMLGSA